MTRAELQKIVFEANLDLYRRRLVIESFGNVSGVDRELGLIAIKPSGVPYETLTAEMMVLVDLDGRVVDSRFRPSSDTKTHLCLYRKFEGIGGVAHAHSRYATAWAQAKRGIPCYGTTHADYFHGEIPVTADLPDDAIARDYETETGAIIVERFRSLDARRIPGVLVAAHGPFSWGRSAAEAVQHMALMEEIALMALQTEALNPAARPIGQTLLDKHYLRKHGNHAYYGQNQIKDDEP